MGEDERFVGEDDDADKDETSDTERDSSVDAEAGDEDEDEDEDAWMGKLMVIFEDLRGRAAPDATAAAAS